jgi:hypothetical protein
VAEMVAGQWKHDFSRSACRLSRRDISLRLGRHTPAPHSVVGRSRTMLAMRLSSADAPRGRSRDARELALPQVLAFARSIWASHLQGE